MIATSIHIDFYSRYEQQTFTGVIYRNHELISTFTLVLTIDYAHPTMISATDHTTNPPTHTLPTRRR